MAFADKRLFLSGGGAYFVILRVKFVACIFGMIVISRYPSRAIVYKSGSFGGLFM